MGASETALVPACLLQGGHEPPNPKPALFTQKETGANIEVGGQHLVALRGAGTSLLGFLTVMQGSGRGGGGRGPWGEGGGRDSALPDRSPHPSGAVHASPGPAHEAVWGRGCDKPTPSGQQSLPGEDGDKVRVGVRDQAEAPARPSRPPDNSVPLGPRSGVSRASAHAP